MAAGDGIDWVLLLVALLWVVGQMWPLWLYLLVCRLLPHRH